MPEDRVHIEEALRSTMIAAWDDFSTVAFPRAIRVEYQCEPGLRVDDLTIWLVREGGYQERVCDYRTGHTTRFQAEWRCWAKVHSSKLFGALDFIMRHQERFFLTPDGSRNGVLVIFPPTQPERAAADVWLAEINSSGPLAPAIRSRAAVSMRAS
jgi:hypothetical protein